MRQVYLDESVRPGRHMLAASETDAHGAAAVRRALGDLVLSGQRRLHFKSESAARRRAILDAIADLPVSTTVLVCRGVGEADSRRLLLTALTRLIQSAGTESTLFIERVDGSIALDQSAITSARRREPALTWHHLTGSARALSWGREVTRDVAREVTVDATTAARRALSSRSPSARVPFRSGPGRRSSSWFCCSRSDGFDRFGFSRVRPRRLLRPG